MKKQLLSLAVLATISFTAQAQPTNGLVSHYSFNDLNFNDAVGINHLAPVGMDVPTFTTDRFGNSEKACYFNGNAALDEGVAPGIHNLNLWNQMTISVWVKPEVVSGSHAIIGRWNSNATQEQYLLEINNGKTLTAVRTVNNGGVFDATTYVPNNWYHIVFMYDKVDDNRHRVFVNGVETLNQTFAGTYSNAVYPAFFVVGNRAPGANPFTGAIDDIRIYDRTLTPQEVTELFYELSPDMNAPISQYSFNGNFNDNIGPFHLSTESPFYVPTFTDDRFGNNNKACYFNGSAALDGILIPSMHTLNVLDELAISVWVKPEIVTGSRTIIGRWNGLSGAEQYLLEINNGKTLTAVRAVNNGGVLDTATYVADNWYHIVFMYSKADNNRHRVFVNGVETLNQTFAGLYTQSTNTAAFFLGRRASSGSPFTGAIDDIKIYGRVLTLQEIDDLFNESDPCIVNIPDVNFKNYLVGNATINTNGDNEIQCSEATAFTGEINVWNMNISDLTGIEAFTAFTNLNCEDNQLTNLDVSNNTALQHLGCSRNLLTSLDVSNNINLETLVFNANQITQIDLSNNTVLTHLQCMNNQLTDLILSGNNMRMLLCGGNFLTSIDVSNHSQLHTFYCNENLITNVDVSNNPALTNMSFSNNQLSSLNLANGTNTSSIHIGADNNPNLTCVQVDDATYSTDNWTGGYFMFDAGVFFSENCSLGISEAWSTELVEVYPNPTNNILNISTTEQVTITLVNVLGKTIATQKLNPGNNTIDVSGLNKGVYFIHHSGFKAVKFIKE